MVPFLQLFYYFKKLQNKNTGSSSKIVGSVALSPTFGPASPLKKFPISPLLKRLAFPLLPMGYKKGFPTPKLQTVGVTTYQQLAADGEEFQKRCLRKIPFCWMPGILRSSP